MKTSIDRTLMRMPMKWILTKSDPKKQCWYALSIIIDAFKKKIIIFKCALIKNY
jgi:molybdopterin synthase catalytic subunit